MRLAIALALAITTIASGQTPSISKTITTPSASGGLLAADFNGTIGTQSITPVAGNGGSAQFDFTNVPSAPLSHRG